MIRTIKALEDKVKCLKRGISETMDYVDKRLENAPKPKKLREYVY